VSLRGGKALRAAIFDFDGLILNTEEAEYEALKAVFREYGAEIRYEDWAVCIGTTNALDFWDHLKKVTGGPVDRSAAEKRYRELDEEILARTPLSPGVKERLEEAKALGLKLAVASSSSQKWLERHLGERGLMAFFDFLSARGGAVRHKPHPDTYLRALTALGVKFDEAVALEDSPNGIKSAGAAGIYTIAVPNPVTKQLDLSSADEIVPSLLDVSFKALAERFMKGDG